MKDDQQPPPRQMLVPPGFFVDARPARARADHMSDSAISKFITSRDAKIPAAGTNFTGTLVASDVMVCYDK